MLPSTFCWIRVAKCETASPREILCTEKQNIHGVYWKITIRLHFTKLVCLFLDLFCIRPHLKELHLYCVLILDFFSWFIRYILQSRKVYKHSPHVVLPHFFQACVMSNSALQIMHILTYSTQHASSLHSLICLIQKKELVQQFCQNLCKFKFPPAW